MSDKMTECGKKEGQKHLEKKMLEPERYMKDRKKNMQVSKKLD
jgi:hypothetical protein